MSRLTPLRNLLGALLCLTPALASAQLYPPGDSVRSASYITRQITYGPRYPFVQLERNLVQWSRPEALTAFFGALAQADSQRVTVVHIGDSHVQADIYPHEVRTRLERIFGAGGRGMIFPYSAARTHPGADYVTYHHGAWAFAKNIHPEPILPLGLTGYTVHTRDPRAGFKIAFTERSNLAGNTRLRLWLDPVRTSYGLRIYYGDPQPLVVFPDTSPYLEARLPYAPTDLQVLLAQRPDSSADRLELYGLSLDIPLERGLIYHSVGVNGATFESVLRQEKMDAQLRALNPHLIVLDISGNEYYGRPFDPIDFELKLRTTVRRLRSAVPAASILITCSQDIYRRYWNVAATEPASALARQVAFDLGCGFYDYFAVSGGRLSMLKWREAGLAKRDRVHLTADGYRLKGELFANALLTSYRAWLGGLDALTDTLVEPPPPSAFTNASEASEVGQPLPMSLRAPAPVRRPAGPPPGSVAPKGSPLVHIVKSGEVLGSIAQRYRVSIAAIQQWNNLRSSRIYAGQKLMLYVSGGPKSNPPATTAATKAAPPKASARAHTVRPGESLWTIAKKYGTTVEALKAANQLTREQLRPGQRLRLP